MTLLFGLACTIVVCCEFDFVSAQCCRACIWETFSGSPQGSATSFFFPVLRQWNACCPRKGDLCRWSDPLPANIEQLQIGCSGRGCPHKAHTVAGQAQTVCCRSLCRPSTAHGSLAHPAVAACVNSQCHRSRCAIPAPFPHPHVAPIVHTPG